MKKIYLLAIAAFAITASLFAQPGVIDVTFGNGGKVHTPFDTATYQYSASAIALQPDGKFVVAVNTLKGYSVVRYMPNGTLDPSFGTGGKVLTRIGSYSSSHATCMALQADGKIVLGGEIYFYRAGVAMYDFGLIRYNTDGSIDQTFGDSTWNGIRYAAANVGQSDEATAMVIRPNGKIVVGGSTYTNNKAGYGLAQFNTNGSLDNTFGNNGIVSDTSTQGVNAMLLLPNGKIVISSDEHWYNPSGYQLLRFNTDGSLDNTFGTNGRVHWTVMGSSGRINSLALDASGNMVAAGYINIPFPADAPGIVFRMDAAGVLDNSFGTNGYSIISPRPLSNTTIYKAVHVLPNADIMATGYTAIDSSADFLITRLKSNGDPDSTYGRRGNVITDFWHPGVNDAYDASNASVMQPDGKIVLAGSSAEDGYDAIGLARYEQNGLVYYNTIQGSAFVDLNANGTRDPNENWWSGANISIVKPGRDTVHVMGYNGPYGYYNHFYAEVDTGAYITSVNQPRPYYTIVPGPQTTAHTNYFNTDSFQFAIQPIPGMYDVAVSAYLVPWRWTGGARAYATVSYYNPGTETIASGTIKLVFDTRMIYDSTYPVPPASVVGNTITMNYTNLQPGGYGYFHVYFTLPASVHIGDTLQVSAEIPLASDVAPANNVDTSKSVVHASYDPNDKTEAHAGKITLGQVNNGEYLTYTIRFQNTGDDTAYNVYLRDTLDSQLDWNSFQMLTASHNYQMTMDDGKCKWTFSNINLLDSNTNERLSHGYLVYRIKPKSTVQVGDVIKNGAAIYFDYNLPVQTKVDTTIVVSNILPLRLLAFTASKDGKVNKLQWSTGNEVNVNRFEVERSANGREYNKIGVVRSGLSDYFFTDNSPLTAYNYYRLKMIDNDANYSYSPVRRIDNSGSFVVSIYPNPVKDKLQVNVESEKKGTLQVQIVTQDGKAVFSTTWNVSEGSAGRMINTSALQKGSYFIRVTSEDKEQTVVMFEKM